MTQPSRPSGAPPDPGRARAAPPDPARARAAPGAAPAFLADGGDAGALMRRLDWSVTPLGPPDSWPQVLQTLVALMLASRQAMFVVWGPERTMLYNDRYAEILVTRHPWAMGQPFDAVWPEIWDSDLEPIVARAYAGEPIHMEDITLTMLRRGYPEETHFAFSYTPVRDASGQVAGFFCPCDEITEQVFEDGRAHLRAELTDRLRELDDEDAIMAVAAELLGRHLKVDCVGYAAADEAGETVSIRQTWTAPEARGVAGDYRLADFGTRLGEELRGGRTLVVHDWHKVPEPDALQGALAAISVRALIDAPLVVEGRFAGVLFVLSETPRYWTVGEVKLVEEVAERTWSVLQRVRAAAALRESEARFRTITEAMPQMVWTADPQGRVDFYNARWYEFTGRPEGSTDGERWIDLCHPDDREACRTHWFRSVATGAPYELEHRLQHASGAYRWVLGRAAALRDGHGRTLRWMGTCTDIDEMKRAEQRRQLLVDELNHRVKNTLAVVQGMAHQTFRGIDLPLGTRRAFQGRLAALAAAHDLLTRANWERATLDDLVRDAVRVALGPDQERVEIEGPRILLPPKQAVSFAMALHELCTNALKHGALSTDAGRVAVRWSVPNWSERCLSFVWREADGPPVVPPQRRNFGMRLIEQALAQDLGGAVEVEFAPDGLVCRIEAALRHDSLRVPQLPFAAHPEGRGR
jgi:PAS domain S-box-containing protein